MCRYVKYVKYALVRTVRSSHTTRKGAPRPRLRTLEEREAGLRDQLPRATTETTQLTERLRGVEATAQATQQGLREQLDEAHTAADARVVDLTRVYEAQVAALRAEPAADCAQPWGTDTVKPAPGGLNGT